MYNTQNNVFSVSILSFLQLICLEIITKIQNAESQIKKLFVSKNLTICNCNTLSSFLGIFTDT